MLSGLWTVEFGSSSGSFGGGVAVFRQGKILGGDGGYFYLGSYEVHDMSFTATLTVQPFAERTESVFGTTGKMLTLKLVGTLKDDAHAIAQGYLTDMPETRLGVKLTKRSEIG
jgi:hypothetical protein